MLTKVQAHQCSYCGKLFLRSKSCKSHERRCYFNPNTRSCASCAFLKWEWLEYKPGYVVKVRSCLQNVDIQKKLNTGCEKYLNYEYGKDPDIMKVVLEEQYDRQKVLQVFAKKAEKLISRV